MSKEYLKTQEGYVPVGDTQGLVVQQGAPMLLYDCADIPGAIAASTETWLIPRNISMQRDMEMDAAGYIKVKEGDVINVTFPDCRWTGNVRMMVAILCYTTTKVRCQYVRNSMEQPGTELPHKTLTIVVRQDGFIRLRLYNQSAAISNLVFGISEYSGYTHVTRIEQRVPYFVANKGALVSNDTSGGVTFDNDGKLSIVQEMERVPVRLRGSTTEGTWTGQNGQAFFCRTGNVVTVTLSLYAGTLTGAEGQLEVGPIPAKWRVPFGTQHGGIAFAYIGSLPAAMRGNPLAVLISSTSEWWQMTNLASPTTNVFVNVVPADTWSMQAHGSTSYMSPLS
jgi:hypothetical protein